MPEQYDVAVIGAGASGLMAAGRAAEKGARVLLLEKMENPGKKLLLTGKTRCNLSNIKDLKGFIAMFGNNGSFLYRALHVFSRDNLLSMLRSYGLETKVERGGRIFPVSDNAGDVLRVLCRFITDNHVTLRTGIPVRDIDMKNGRITGVRTDQEHIGASSVILAAGGKTYPLTGSTGDGYKMASALGHTIEPLYPALVPLVVKEVEQAASIQGISLKNVRLTAFSCASDQIDLSMIPSSEVGRGFPAKKLHPPVIESRMGEMMMTHFGLGGPITMLMSLAVVRSLKHNPVSVVIDLKPAIRVQQLHERLQREFNAFGKRSLYNIMLGLIPKKMVRPLIALMGLPESRPANQISAAERGEIINRLKFLTFNIQDSLPLSRAVVTAGGIRLGEIDPLTMSSRLIPGLYFCGEVLDIDAETGGYNLQAAFSTGYLAGESAALFALSEKG